jgi:hypothetical protein
MVTDFPGIIDGGNAEIMFSTPNIKHHDGIDVVFDATSGTITLDAYGNAIGEQISGTFDATLEGVKSVDETPENDITITGTISGRFSGILQQQEE